MQCPPKCFLKISQTASRHNRHTDAPYQEELAICHILTAYDFYKEDNMENRFVS